MPQSLELGRSRQSLRKSGRLRRLEWGLWGCEVWRAWRPSCLGWGVNWGDCLLFLKLRDSFCLMPFPAIKKLSLSVIILSIPRWVFLNFISAYVIALTIIRFWKTKAELIIILFLALIIFPPTSSLFSSIHTVPKFWPRLGLCFVASYLMTLTSTPSFQEVLHILYFYRWVNGAGNFISPP